MYILRSVSQNDLDDLFNLSSLVFFINLPEDKKLIKRRIDSSIKAFQKPSQKKYENYYIFVLEDDETNQVVGVSMIHAQHGNETEPHFFLKIDHEKKFSSSINTGFIHGTLKLGTDTDGPTEIGGLVLHPRYRGNGEKLGKQLSFVRLLYMGLFPERFKSIVHSELMPPLDEKGNSPLWEAIGRRFLNMGYQEADKLSRNNKEFILNLFPSEIIYQTLLPLEARDSIGKVGKDTLPVKKMLESIGFKYIQEVDPFDGGPHYRCPLKEIAPIKKLTSAKIAIDPKLKYYEDYLITKKHPEYEFWSIRIKGKLEDGVLTIKNKNINLEIGDVVSLIPF